MFRLTPVVRAILAANLVLYAAAWLLGDAALAPLELWPVGTDIYYPGLPFRPWQLLSYGFVHFQFWHLAMNMLALVVFGPDVERLLGGRRFQGYYLACVVGAAIAQLAVMRLMGQGGVPTVGASGGIFGLLLAFGLAWPHRRLLLLFPPVPVPAWLFVTGYALIELYEGVVGRNEGVAHFAHLGGMAAGWLLLLHWRRTGAARPAG